ncbi:MAG TPA: substrate-binding domain-containing protein [Firmicutes bacterium]|nr:substrate-binding domain-containing protein [Bacillota bacterium]
MKRRKIALLLAGLMAASMLAGCSSDAGNGNSGSGSSGSGDSGNGDSGSEAITVITREDGSGTRGAFVELTGVEADGEDQTTEEAVVANQTEAVITQVSGDPAAIGYISLGSLNDTVKALKVEGVEATPENVKNGTYTVARPFYIATKGEATGVAADFISFIMSKQGQEIVSDGYIAVNDAAADFAGTQPEGKIVVAGSSSVTPVMEKLQEAYLELNPNATIEIQQTDSSAGMTAAIDGTCDIGMASRELKDSELAELTPTQIAMDGIAVIVNQDNALDDITMDQIRQIYTGEVTDWADVQ